MGLGTCGENMTQKSPHSWDMVEARFECWHPGLKWQSKQNFQARFWEELKEKKKSPSAQANSGHATQLIYFSIHSCELLVGIIELMASLSSADP